jgi:predicted nucleotidyltransferase
VEYSYTDGLTDKDRQQIREVFSNFPQVKQAILYGSRVLGRYHVGSDIDLTLIAIKESKLDLPKLNQISESLDDLLLPYEINLSSFEDIDNAELKEHISRVGAIFYTVS